MKKKEVGNCTLYVKGMHCNACESLIESELKQLNGIKKVKASLNESKVTFQISDKSLLPSVENLNRRFKAYGYTLQYTVIPNVYKHTLKNYLTALGLAGLVLLLIILLDRTTKINFNLDENSNLFVYFIFGLLAGVSSCAALVGGILLSLTKKWNEVYTENSGNSKTPFILFISGRLISFAVLGGILGALGSFFKINPIQTSVLIVMVSFLMIILSLQMLGLGFANKIKIKAPTFITRYMTNDIKGRYVPFIIGSLTFFIPCGLTIVAQTNALATGSFILSSFNLLAFALGTLPVLLLISFSSIKLYNNKKFAGIVSLTAGFLVIALAFYNLYSQFRILSSVKSLKYNNSSVLSKSNENLSESRDTSSSQILRMTAKGFEYLPKSIELQSGVPITWEIDNQGAQGCSKAVFAYGLHPEVVILKPGINRINISPAKPGTYQISCSMGMVDPVTVTIK
jgi:uncharacterized protein